MGMYRGVDEKGIKVCWPTFTLLKWCMHGVSTPEILLSS
jgi:hypothetical protein